MKSRNSAESPMGGLQPMKLLRFYINGQLYTVKDPDPRTLLVDFLRSNEIGLTGTKKSCGQGGCGACTVMLSYYEAATKTVKHHSINSCLRPICSLDGMMVTTVEGVGSVDTAIDPVQNMIATCNGSQCGWCTPGWVMNMKSFLTQNEGKNLTQAEIEDIFDGNLCRCTGYRPILYAMRHFASDFGPNDEKGVMKTIVDPAEQPEVKQAVITLPDALKRKAQKNAFEKDGYTWYRPTNLDELKDILAQGHGPEELKLVVGNTSYGIYNPFPLDQPDYYNPHHFVDIAWIKELHIWKESKSGLEVGAATTYSEFLERVTELRDVAKGGRRQALDALWYMAKRTAGMIVRNAASLGGNTMLVVHHIDKGSPFPSDLFTALVSLGTRVRVLSSEWDSPRTMSLLDYAHAYAKTKALSRHSVLLGYEIPYLPDNAVARTYKVAIRSENAHSIVNGGIVFELGKSGRIQKSSVVYAGIGPVAFHAKETEKVLNAGALDNATLKAALKTLRQEVKNRLKQFKLRMSGLPNEGFTPDYITQLAESFLYKHFVYALEQSNPGSVPRAIWSAGLQPVRPVSNGTQDYEKYPLEYPVNEPFIKLEAFVQATGEAIYIQDMERSVRGYDAAWVTSNKAYAKISYQIPGKGKPKPATLDQLKAYLAEKYSGYVDYVTYVDIPVQKANMQGGGHDDPLFVVDEVTAYGQSIGLILAEEPILAQEIAYHVATHCIAYDTKGRNPLITISDGIQANSYFVDGPNGSSFPTHIYTITRDGSNLDWATIQGYVAKRDKVVTLNAVVNGIDCLIIQGTQEAGGQIHFYMGPQSALVNPGEHHEVTLFPDSQSPDSVQSTVMEALGLQMNDVDIRIKRLAGAYGGKTTRSPYVATPVAVAANKHRKPVKLMMRRENDTAMVGHRHPTRTVYQIAVGTGKDDPKNKGKIVGLKIDWLFNGGNTYDCSFTVMDCMQLRSSSGYFIPNYQSSGDVVQTQISSNTAFRAFGMLQGTLGLEDSIEAAAWQLGIRPEEIRQANLYSLGQTTPYGQTLDSYYLPQVWDYARKHVEFDRRLAEVEAFNQANRWTKRGISLIPIMYGAGYNAVFLEQGGALIEIYSQDGTVIVRHGAVDMGQGVNTMVTQMTAEALNIPIGFIEIGENDIRVVPNPVSTGASTGTAYNAAAAKEASKTLRKRLEEYCEGLRLKNGEQWCVTKGIDYWNYKDQGGWQSTSTTTKAMIWKTIVSMAYGDRVNLSCQTRFRQGGGKGIDTGLAFHEGAPTEVVNEFVGFTFNVACSEVEVDILTGETTVLRSDLIYDVGKSLNPALDIGQVEGAFIQGVGYMLTEELVYEMDGENKGRLNTLNTWRYKIPAHTTIPLELNVTLFPRKDANVPEDKNLLLGSKETGEPPLVLANTVYFAVKHAVHSARKERGHADWFRMDAPLTPQQVREHCLLEIKNLGL